MLSGLELRLSLMMDYNKQDEFQFQPEDLPDPDTPVKQVI